jgi:signal peptidase I
MVLAALILIGSTAGVFKVDIEQSGSMAPQIPIGAAIIAVPETPNQVRLGQVIAYTPPRPFPNETVVHKVVQIQRATGKTVVVTRGIANQVNDPWKAVLTPHVWHVVGVVPGAALALSILDSWMFQVSTLMIIAYALLSGPLTGWLTMHRKPKTGG